MDKIAYAYPSEASLFDGIDLSALEKMADKKKSALVVVNDATRPTPTPLVLDALVPVLEKFGSYKIIVATGAHRMPTEPEYAFILGSHYQKLRPNCLAHDSKSTENAFLGVTKVGTPVLIDPLVLSSDVLILTGSVEPHYFAGFTGGRKALFPGLAGFQTIKANHRLALSSKATTLKLEDNPVHLDMMDCMSFIPKKEVFSLMTVLSADRDILFCSTGSLEESFNACVNVAKTAFCPIVEDYADIVVTIAKSPTDINLYQAQKAMDNAFAPLKRGGAIILVAKCPDGLGNIAFADLLASCPKPEDAFKIIETGYELGFHKSAKMAWVLSKATVYCVTDLDEKTLAKVFMKKADSVEDAIALAKKDLGLENPNILYLPDGALTVPRVSGGVL